MRLLCPECGSKFVKRTTQVSCSPACAKLRVNRRRKAWRLVHLDEEKERLRDYERRRIRNPPQKEARRKYMRDRYRKMRAAYLAVQELIGKDGHVSQD